MAGPGLESFKHSSAGYEVLMKGAPMVAMLEEKVNRVALVLQSQLSDLDDWEIVADVQVGPNRATGLVSGVPWRIELDRRIMGSAIDAAR